MSNSTQDEKEHQFWIEVRRHMIGICAAIARRYDLQNPLGGSNDAYKARVAEQKNNDSQS